MSRKTKIWIAIAGGLAALAVAFVLVFDWNWLKPLVEAQASRHLGREVRVARLEIRLARQPLVIAEGLSVANPKGFTPGTRLAEIRRMAFTVDVGRRLRDGLWMFPDMTIDGPAMRFERDLDGRANWRLPEDEVAAGTEPQIGRLTVNDGHMRVVDALRETDIEAAIHTEPNPKTGEPEVVLSGAGRYAARETRIAIRGGSLLSLREENIRYPLLLDWQVGDTRVQLEGTVDTPASFSGLDGKLDIRGSDLSQLYDVFGIPLPPSAPYQLTGRVVYGSRLLWFERFKGRMGDSDLSGTVTFHTGGERLRMDGEIFSNKVVLADLAGFVGAEAGEPDRPATAAAPGKRKTTAARPAAAEKDSGRVLPSKSIDVARLNEMDAYVSYKARRVEAEAMPLDNLSVRVELENGGLRLRPLNFGIGTGMVSANVDLDARIEPPRLVLDADFRGVDLNRMLRQSRAVEGAGRLGGRFRLVGRGRSAAEIMANGDGSLSLAMDGGHISAVLTELAGLDLLEGLGFPPTDRKRQFGIRCMVADVAIQDGQLTTRTLVLDTTDTNIVGNAQINFADETLKGRFEPHPKDKSVLTFRGPITLGGTLARPTVTPDRKAQAVRIAAAIGLGALFGPLAALIPTIELGLGKDSDCTALIDSAQRAGQSARRP